MSVSSFEDSLSSNTLSPASHKISKPSITSGNNLKKSSRRAWWTAEEDKILLELIENMGENWALISSKMTNRSGKQIRDRYLNHLRPNINRDQWTSQEDDRILELMKKVGHKWKKISTLLPGRTENQVKTRYYKFLKGKVLSQNIKREEPIKVESPVQTPFVKQPIITSSTKTNSFNWNSNPFANIRSQLAMQTKIDALKLYINVAQTELIRLTTMNVKI